jgi:hypothetical protein
MALFRKKGEIAPPPPKVSPKSLEEIVIDRVLTAEGWQRRTLSKVAHHPSHKSK